MDDLFCFSDNPQSDSNVIPNFVCTVTSILNRQEEEECHNILIMLEAGLTMKKVLDKDKKLLPVSYKFMEDQIEMKKLFF